MTRRIAIDGREIGPGRPPYVIAELSANHNGSLARALDIVRAAKAAGADAVKLQTYRADTITIDHDGPDFRVAGGLWNGARLYDLYEKAAMPWEWHQPLFALAREIGISIFSSPFDASAIALLESLGAPAYKIASLELCDIPLIEAAAATGKPLIMSTGASELPEIEEAVAAARGAGARDLILLKCTSGYPTPPEECNLAVIPHLAEMFDCLVGLSDHTMGIAVPVAAATLGACAIEKHFTLARADGGVDSAFSLEPAELRAMVESVGIAHAALGRVDYGIAASEATTRPLRRSLYVVADIATGEAFTPDNLRSIRPGKGLAPKHYRSILGRRASRPLPRGTALSWEMVGD